MNVPAVPSTNQDLLEQDWMLWQQLQNLSVKDPDAVSSIFDVPNYVIDTVASFSRQTIERLSSGIVGSFKPNIDTRKMVELMQENYSPGMLSCNPFSGSAVGFLINVATSARQDPLVAALSYGIPSEICVEATQCTNSQLAYIASRLEVRFSLRFPPALLLEFGNASADTRNILLLKLSHCLRN